MVDRLPLRENDVSKIKPGQYQHYKGNFYAVIGEARHSETLEEMVVYKALYTTQWGKYSLWVRPKKMFVEKVKIGDRKVARFKLVKSDLLKVAGNVD